jgi:hypothetical protein
MPRIGVGIGIPFRKNSGIDFLLYWTTRFPSALLAVPYSGTRIDLYWTNNGSADYDNVSIEISTDGINFTETSTVAAGEAAANITGLTEVTDYWFRVRYVKGASASAYTDVVQSLTYATTIFDGDSVIWLQYEDLATITKDGSENVTEWRDKLGSANKINSVTTPPLWTTTGIRWYDLDLLRGTIAIGAEYTLYAIIELFSYRLDTVFMQSYITEGIVAKVAGGAETSVGHWNGGNALYAGNYSFGVPFVLRLGCLAAGFTGMVGCDDNITPGYVGMGVVDSFSISSEGTPGNYVTFRIKELIIRKKYNAGVSDSVYNYFVKKKLLV